MTWHGKVEVTSRYLPIMELGGDGFHYRWLDEDHLKGCTSSTYPAMASDLRCCQRRCTTSCGRTRVPMPVLLHPTGSSTNFQQPVPDERPGARPASPSGTASTSPPPEPCTTPAPDTHPPLALQTRRPDHHRHNAVHPCRSPSECSVIPLTPQPPHRATRRQLLIYSDAREIFSAARGSPDV